MLNFNFGLFTGIMIIIGQITGLTLVNLGYQANIAGLVNASMIIGGTIGSQITGNVLQSNGKFKIMLLLVCVLSLVFGILVYIFIES